MTNTKKLSTVRIAVLVTSCLLATPVALRCQMPGAQTLDETVGAALQKIIDSAHHPDLRWADFQPYQAEVKEFYTRTGSTLGWVRDRKPTPQAVAMIALFTGV